MSGTHTRTELLDAQGFAILPAGNFFFLISAGSAVDINFHGDEATHGATGQTRGYVRGSVKPWTRATIQGAPGASVRYSIGYETVLEDFTDFRELTGSFDETLPESVDDIADVDVGGSAVAIQLLPANAARYSATVKLHDDSAVAIRVGKAATVAAGRGLRLAPGQFQTFRAKGAIHAIREGAGVATVSINFEVL